MGVSKNVEIENFVNIEFFFNVILGEFVVIFILKMFYVERGRVEMSKNLSFFSFSFFL